MSRRFPTPLFGVPKSKREVQRVIEIADTSESDEPLSWDAYRERCREQLRKPDSSEPYSQAYIDRITSTFVKLGLIDRDDGNVTPPPPARTWLADEQSFEEFLWQALKRRWVLMGSFPEGIEALERIHRVVRDADATAVSRSTIEDSLATEFDYEFNDEGIRGYPQLLVLLGALEQTDNGYRTTDTESTFTTRFRETDIGRQLERRLKREGANVSPPSARVKRDLAKYYMYRESGGWSKRRTWHETVWKDYLTPKARAGETTNAQFDVQEKYVEADNERKTLRETIRRQFPEIEPRSLSGLSTDVLRRMADAETVQAATRVQLASGSGMSRADLDLLDEDRRPYSFSKEFSLYDWQNDAVDQWFVEGDDDTSRNPEQGIAKVVTGAGKTVMALGVIQRWLEENPDGVVTIVVPTRVLMRQWLTELRAKLQVPTDELGWAGGGHKDSFTDGCRVLVSVVNSAVKDDYLGGELTAAGEPPHLLIADECHRYTGDTFSNIFSYSRTASLGLSATPLSSTDDDERSADDELLLSELGPIYYELTYAEGLDRGLIPKFTVKYIGFELTEYERHPYEQFSRKISNAVSDIEARYGPRLNSLSGNYAQKLQVLLNETDGPAPAISDYFEFTQERRELVANAVQRQALTYHLLDRAIDEEKKSIVFQERIEQLERMIAPHETRGINARTGDISDDAGYRTELYRQDPSAKHYDQKLEQLFQRAAYKPVMYHSGHSRDVWNDFAMEWFRDGFANVMLSVKALVEGVDVPSADVGIVRVSNSSVRQRIQTLGRVLRTGIDESRHSELYVLYARNTVDERIFAEYDWDEQLANADVEHYIWEPNSLDDTDESDLGQLREASTDEYPDAGFEPPEIPDVDELDRGDPYLGPRDGYQISVDANGDPFEKTNDGRQPIVTPAVVDAAEYVYEQKGGGTVYINEANHLITILKDGPVFLGTIAGIDAIEYGEASGGLLDDPVSLDDLGFSQ